MLRVPHLFMICVCAALCACAQPRPRDGGVLPDDFALSVTVLGAAPAADAPTDLAPAWFILSQDNALRAQWAVRTRRSPPPPVARILSRTDVAGIYQLALEAGVLGHAPASHRIADASDALADSPAPGAGRRAIVIEYTAGGTRRAFLFLPGEGPSAPWHTASALARRLGAIARPGDHGAAGGG